jgi:hypothetical protein
VPTAAGFDVINDVDVDGYLKSVVPKEMLPDWTVEAYKAQAIVARTYALYTAKTSGGQTWDLFPDTRSQVYGGLASETPKSQQASMKPPASSSPMAHRGRKRSSRRTSAPAAAASRNLLGTRSAMRTRSR